MGIRSFLVGVVFGAGGFWAVDQGYAKCAFDFIVNEVRGEAVTEGEEAAPETPAPAPVVEEVVERPEPVAPASSSTSFSGEASYYAASLDGNPTASGEPYDHDAMTAAHRELPFGTMVRVTNRETGASVVVRINDRGPYADDRVIDVSGAAAEQLGMIEAGVIMVDVDVLSTPE